MKRKLFKLLSLIAAGIIGFSSVPVYAYELDASGNSIEDETYQSDTDEDFNNETSVFAQLGSHFEATIPKVIVLDGDKNRLIMKLQ